MSQLREKISAEIQEAGSISFARFMELALYCPEYGYYERERDRIGVKGDYYTNVSIGPLFGQLLAFQFAEWLEQGPKLFNRSPLQIVEAGAHDGLLAQDILSWIKIHRNELYQRLEYWIIEPSENRRGWQEKTLDALGPTVRWAKGVEELRKTIGGNGIRGVIFANELLDAMPVRRMSWDASQQIWFEWGVAICNGKFCWSRMRDDVTSLAETSKELAEAAPELLAVLPDGYTVDLCPAAGQWWLEATQLIERGVLLGIDYGYGPEGLWSPERTRGTLRAYRNHHSTKDVLAAPGDQDITAHVDFGFIEKVGTEQGMNTLLRASQEQFLMGILRRWWGEHSAQRDWPEDLTRAIRTLTHPGNLGRAFTVLAQARL